MRAGERVRAKLVLYMPYTGSGVVLHPDSFVDFGTI